MAKRKTTNMKGLVVHVTGPKFHMSEESVLRKKFKNGTITTEELRRLASFIAIQKKANTPCQINIEVEITIKKAIVPRYYIKCWDKWIQCTKTQYDIAPSCARKIIYEEI